MTTYYRVRPNTMHGGSGLGLMSTLLYLSRFREQHEHGCTFSGRPVGNRNYVRIKAVCPLHYSTHYFTGTKDVTALDIDVDTFDKIFEPIT